jgi:hypothetical protein
VADYAALVEAWRQLRLDGYESYADVGLDGPWTTPYHLASSSPTGPVLLTYNYLDAPSARLHHDQLAARGYLPTMPFNRVLDLALLETGLTRADLYVTHAFHLLPLSRSAVVPAAAIDVSFDAIARHELAGRRVIALGAIAARCCRRHGIAATATPHPSARGTGFSDRARTLADALRHR